MPKVLIAPTAFFHVPGPYVKLLQAAGLEVVYPPKADPRSEADTLACLQGVSAIIAGGEFLNEKLLNQLPDLRVIARAGVGYDRVDIPAATQRNIAVTITPTANHESVAEHALGLLLALSRNIVGHHLDVLAGDWSRRRMVPVRGMTLGLVGLGRIGRSVAVRAQAFRLRVIAHDQFVDPELAKQLGVELVDLPTLFAQSDYISLHAPLNETTSGLINRQTLALMKPGGFLINTARGGLVVEEDVCAALESGQLAGAALDVFEVEPTPTTNPLLKQRNLIATPHLASGDYQSMEDMGTESARNIIALYQGGWPEGAVVNPQIRPTFHW